MSDGQLRNLITDIAGVKVGHAHDENVRTGVSVIVPDGPAICAVDVRGGGPGTRETDLLQSGTLVDCADAIVFAGGSVYGLGAADGVCAVMGAEGKGFGMLRTDDVPRSPIIPAAILFDLTNGGNKKWGEITPYNELGKQAYKSASSDFKLGNAGAGYGALEDGLKGGTGSASVQFGNVSVGAYVCVNSYGSTIMPGTDAFYAHPYEINNEFGGRVPPHGYKLKTGDWDLTKSAMTRGLARENTSLAVIATDVALTHSQCQRLATMAQDGLARAIRPIHSPFDGDVVFAMSCGEKSLKEPKSIGLAHLGALAADTLTRAVARAIYSADTLGSHKSYRDHFKVD